jgi:hypothetical protein
MNTLNKQGSMKEEQETENPKTSEIFLKQHKTINNILKEYNDNNLPEYSKRNNNDINNNFNLDDEYKINFDENGTTPKRSNINELINF